MNIRRLFTSLATALAVGAVAAPSQAEPVLLDRIVATVDTQRIFRSDVMRRARPYLARLAKDASANPAQAAAVARAAAREVSREIVARMIDETLIAIECERSGIRVEPSDVDRAIESIARSNNAQPKDIFAEAAKQGLSEKDYREEVRRQILEAKWIYSKIRPTIVAPIVGTDAEKARATAQLTEAARKAELTRLRKETLVVLRW